MKMKKFLPFFLCAGLLASCGGTAPVDSSSEAGKSDTKVASSSTVKSSHTHTFDETKWENNDSQHWHPATCEHTTQKGSAAAHDFEEVAGESKAATCQEEGKKVEKCKICNYKKETKLAKTAHAWGAESATVKPEGKSGYKTKECTTCHTKDLVLDALSWTKIEGSNKDSSGATLKFSSNGNYAEYEFTVPAAMSNVTIGLWGWVDYWKDGSTNNDQRGFFSRKSGEGANVEVKLGDTAVEITNHGTYEEMGLPDGEGSNSGFGLCEMGTVASIPAGDLKVTYTRLESYNLNITEIHFLYK